MASDAHAHPYDLSCLDSAAEASRRALGASCAASAWGQKDFLYNEALSRTAAAGAAAPVALCFGVHPQLPLAEKAGGATRARDSLDFLGTLLAEKRIAAVGECGYDLFNAAYRETEAVQEELFVAQIEAAARDGLPLVLHARRAMHKIFTHIHKLRTLKAVVFHAYAGTAGEAASLVRRGVNAYFSFGNALLLNHKQARAACAAVEPGRLLFETDAPYQSQRGRAFSAYTDLAAIREEAARLRGEAAAALETQADAAFSEVFGT